MSAAAVGVNHPMTSAASAPSVPPTAMSAPIAAAGATRSGQSTCPHLTSWYDSLQHHFMQTNANISQPPPAVLPGLTDLHMLFQYASYYAASAKVPSAYRSIKLPNCGTCRRSAVRLHACITCVFIACQTHNHIHRHMLSTTHSLSVDLSEGTVFCWKCNDVVYHAGIAELQRHAVSEANRKRRRREDFCFPPQDVQLLRNASRPIQSLNESLLGLRGLLNLGQTCFMSVCIQALCHNPYIRMHFLSDCHNQDRCQRKRALIQAQTNGGAVNGENSSGKGSLCLACDMDDVFQQMYSGQTEPYAPCRLLQSMWSHNDLLAGYQQQDAHEFLISLLDGVHSSIEGHTSYNTLNGTNSPLPQCKCLIHHVFGGTLRSDLVCANCRTTNTNPEHILDLSLDITNRHANTPTSVSSSTPLSLTDCLSRFTQTERLEAFNCRTCAANVDHTKQLSFIALPTTLTVHLKRFQRSHNKPNQSTKNDTFVSFPLSQLDLTPYMYRSLVTPLSPSQAASSPAQQRSNNAAASAVAQTVGSRPAAPSVVRESAYDLYCLIVHRGEMNSGHYICFVRHLGDWFKIDDKVVTHATESEVEKQQAYLLVYCRPFGKES